MFDLDGPLKINFKNHIGALEHAFFNGFFRGAVAMVVNIGPLHEGICLNHGIEFLFRDEKVFPTVFFLTARGSGGVGHRGLDVGVKFKQCFDQA